MDKNSNEFIDLVLYGLLPYSNTKYAKRVSTFPVFMNIKQFFKNYNYSDSDWKIIANLIFDLVKNFQQNPDILPKLIEQFCSNEIHSRSFQCGTISPILFCINDSYPIVNNRVIHTYNDFSSNFNWDDIMSPKLEKYIENIEKCNKLISFINMPELKDYTIFDLFCYWYDHLYEMKGTDIDDEDETDIYQTEEKTKIPVINIPKFLDEIILDNSYKLETHSLRNPERVKIRQIIENCQKGIWVLPNFQRYYTWNKKDVKEFLESIFNDYYVGAFLLWDSANQDNRRLDVIPIKGADIKKEEMRPTHIILDGQQRLTSIYYAIKAPGFNLSKSNTPLYFYVNFANILKKNQNGEIIEVLSQKIDGPESYKRLLFPLFNLERYDDWANSMEDYMLTKSEDKDKIRNIRRIIDKKLRHIIDGYEIPYISLPESMELSQITEIFEKINTMGKKLDSFDLLIARLSIYDIELKKLWEEATRRYPNLPRYHKQTDKMPIYILQSISLTYNKTSACSKEDILNIYQNIFEQSDLSFDEIWYQMTDYTNRAILKLENLRDGFGVKDETELPFAPTIPILASLLHDIESRTNKLECYKKINTWYWSSVFSNAYSGAVDSQLTLDFREMRSWFSDDHKIPKTIETARNIVYTINLKNIQARGSAIFKGIMSILALRGSKDFDTSQVLENVSSNDRDHIFPKSRFSFKDNINSVVNMAWMSEETNRKIKKYETPSEYIKNFLSMKYANNEKEFQSVLETHLINKEAYENMLKDNFDGFLSEREKLIFSEIRKLLGIYDDEVEQKKSSLITPEKPFTNKVIMWNTIKECQGFIYWIDKYFSIPGLELLSESIDTNKVKFIKILTSIPNTNLKLKESFIKFKKEMNNQGVDCELRVITDKGISSKIHDRWILSKYVNFNIPSPDVVSRGQYSEVKKTEVSFPFDDMWNKGYDIIARWNDIERSIKEYQMNRF